MSANEYINESCLTKDVHALICCIHTSESWYAHVRVMSTNKYTNESCLTTNLHTLLCCIASVAFVWLMHVCTCRFLSDMTHTSRAADEGMRVLCETWHDSFRYLLLDFCETWHDSFEYLLGVFCASWHDSFKYLLADFCESWHDSFKYLLVVFCDTWHDSFKYLLVDFCQTWPTKDAHAVICCIHMNESCHEHVNVTSTNEYINKSSLTKDAHALIYCTHMNESWTWKCHVYKWIHKQSQVWQKTYMPSTKDAHAVICCLHMNESCREHVNVTSTNKYINKVKSDKRLRCRHLQHCQRCFVRQ